MNNIDTWPEWILKLFFGVVTLPFRPEFWFVLLIVGLSFFFDALGRANAHDPHGARADTSEPTFQNQDILAPWNNPLQKNDILAPWNDPLLKDDVLAPWNDIVTDKESTNEYLRENGVDDTDYYYDYEDPDDG